MTSLSCFSVHFLAPLRVLSLDTVALASCLVTDAAAGVGGGRRVVDLRSNGGVRTDERALVALDADRGIPHGDGLRDALDPYKVLDKIEE